MRAFLLVSTTMVESDLSDREGVSHERWSGFFL